MICPNMSRMGWISRWRTLWLLLLLIPWIAAFIYVWIQLLLFERAIHNNQPSSLSHVQEENEEAEIQRTTRNPADTADDDLNYVNNNRTTVSQLRWPFDYEQFTIRINTWKRETALRLIVRNYLSKCQKTVAAIQVVWCSKQGPVPTWLLDLATKKTTKMGSGSRVMVEIHQTDSSLNARFDWKGHEEPPTAAILSQDDDIIRPCRALNAGFALWQLNPDRLVGYDPRLALQNWTVYGDFATADSSNLYNLALTKMAFLHKDYLKSYTYQMPPEIRRHVVTVKNCEDIAMSLWISFRTHYQLPLLADAWAMQSVVNVIMPLSPTARGDTAAADTTTAAISKDPKHQSIRNHCVQYFAQILNITTTTTTMINGRNNNDNDNDNNRMMHPVPWRHVDLPNPLLQAGIWNGNVQQPNAQNSNISKVVHMLYLLRQRWYNNKKGTVAAVRAARRAFNNECHRIPGNICIPKN